MTAGGVAGEIGEDPVITLRRLGIEVRPQDDWEPKGQWGTSWLVRRPGRTDVFLKRPRSEAEPHRRLLRVEAAATRVGPGAPAVLASDSGALACVAASDHRDALALAGEGRLDPDLARAIGAMAAGIHTSSQLGATVDADGPLMEDSDHVTPAELASGPGHEYREYLAFIHRDDALRAALSALKASWHAGVPIHGDLKTDNILVGSGERPAVVVIDWELARLGDPRWDLGHLLGSLLMAWLVSIRPVGGETLEDWLANASTPLETVRPLLAALLAGYRAASPPLVVDTEADDLVALQYAGVFLLQRALASLTSSGLISRGAWCSLYMGSAMVTRPVAASRLLLG